MRYLFPLFLALALCGCPKPAANDPAPAVAAVTADPVVGKIALNAVPLSAQHRVEVLAKEASLAREQERQSQIRKALIAAAILLLAGGLVALAGKLFPAMAGWYGVILAWVGKQVRWRSVIIALVVGAGCICGAIWLDLLWGYIKLAGCYALVALALFATWELACLHYTGAWTPDGLVRLPKGWQVAPEKKG